MAFEVASADIINQYIGLPGTLIVDIRDSESFRRAHIATAVNIPYMEFEENISLFSRYETVILYCERGNASLYLAKEYGNLGPLFLTLAGGFGRNKAKFVIDGIE